MHRRLDSVLIMVQNKRKSSGVIAGIACQSLQCNFSTFDGGISTSQIWPFSMGIQVFV